MGARQTHLAERHATDSKEGLAAKTLEVLPAAVLHVDAFGTIVLANQRAAEILEKSQEEIENRAFDHVLPAAKTLQKRPFDPACDGELTLASGKIIGFRLTRCDDSHRLEGLGEFVMIFQDITATEKLRDERDKLLQLAAVGDVMPTLLHEIKNPLAAVVTAVELLVEDAPDELTAQELHAVLTEIRRIGLTLDGVGLVGRSLNDMRFTAIDFCIREVCKILTGIARRKQVEIETKIATMPLLPLSAPVVRALVMNLVKNAIEACDNGDRVKVTACLVEGPTLYVAVEDTGHGMDEESAARCQELFYTTKEKGSGIGLALCSETVRKSGGELRVESKLGQGSKVTIELPINEFEATQNLSTGGNTHGTS